MLRSGKTPLAAAWRMDQAARLGVGWWLEAEVESRGLLRTSASGSHAYTASEGEKGCSLGPDRHP